ncbi:MAG: DUF3341 domain-containing protein [Candidatus Sumerlaeia bacterium]|nr:DUF3341 domain-containing protein [Candidatus Sumerlaeia bacterium]
MAPIQVPAAMAFYDDADDLMYVTEKARVEKGYKDLDAYTPYPVHGLEDALGLKMSWVSTVARMGLVAGWGLGFLFQSWTSAIDWPVNIGGKPFVSWPAWIPITFETGVLLAGFCNLLALFVACGLYPRPKTVIVSKRVTNDRFTLVVPIRENQTEAEVVAFLREHKALKIKIIDGIDKERQRVIFRAPMEEEPVTA